MILAQNDGVIMKNPATHNNDKILHVGDIVVVTTCMSNHEYLITRVTNTLAKSRRADGYEHTFKRKISSNMSHPYSNDKTEYRVKKRTPL